MSYRLPLLLGLAHGVSDAAAGLLVGLIIQQKLPGMNTQILFYNLLAFGLQPLAGLLLDRLRQPKPGAAAGLLLTATGVLVVGVNLHFALWFIGLGSAFLHAGGGSVAITSTPGKASAAGVFAAFGVIGLALGGLTSFSFSPTVMIILVALLATLAMIIWLAPQAPVQPIEAAKTSLPVSEILILVLVIAIALRSTVWVGEQSSVARFSLAAVWLALAAGTGKLLGGFLADRLGWRRWMIISLIGAGLLFVFGGSWFPALLLGALLLQSVTPLSIAAAGRALPKFPALAASLALGLAIIAGGLPFFMFPTGWFGKVTLTLTLCLSLLLYGFVLGKTRLGSER